MSTLERFEKSPMTATPAEALIKIYGQGLPEDEFIDTLPLNARIIDIGSGRSNFGEYITAKRSDINWINYDKNYDEQTINNLSSPASPNLSYVKGDVFRIPNELFGKFNRVFSYNLFPHLIRVNRQLGRQALIGSTRLLTHDGVALVGPTNNKSQDIKRGEAIKLTGQYKYYDLERTLDLMTSSRLANFAYTAMDQTGIGVYPASRFSMGENGYVVSNDGGLTYHKIVSKKGFTLTVSLLKEFLKLPNDID